MSLIYIDKPDIVPQSMFNSHSYLDVINKVQF